ncbi:MAG TPA: hypothetical protein VFF58_00720 [Candidatus Nitrosotalea sp.]|nr:hypothetical protein [Candidatus Nitrosotalea sp.]
MKRFLILLALVAQLWAQTPNNARMLSGVNAQTGTTYPFVALDATRLTTFANASAIAATISSPIAAGFGAGTEFDVQNLGPGALTITCACTIFSSNSTGATTLQLAASQGAQLFSSGASYTAIVSGAGLLGPGVAAPAWLGNWEGAPQIVLSPLGQGNINTGLANQLQIWEFRLLTPFSFNTLTLQTSNVSGNPHAGFAIYCPPAGNTNCTANARLVHWDNLTLQFNNFTYQLTPTGGAVLLQPGYYYWACAVDTTTGETTAGGLTNSGSGESVKPWNISVTRNGFGGNLMSSGILPATIGTLTPGAQGGGLAQPVWIVEP